MGMEKVQSRLLIITKEMVSFFAKDRAINAVVALFIYLYIYILFFLLRRANSTSHSQTVDPPNLHKICRLNSNQLGMSSILSEPTEEPEDIL